MKKNISCGISFTGYVYGAVDALVVGGTVAIFAVIAIVLFVIMAFFARPLAVLLQAPEEAIDATTSYIRICGCGMFFIVAYKVISSIFRGFGDSKMPLLFVAVACAANIAGDWFFAGLLKMDASGAALATVLARALSVILALTVIRLVFGQSPPCAPSAPVCVNGASSFRISVLSTK